MSSISITIDHCREYALMQLVIVTIMFLEANERINEQIALIMSYF